MVEQLHPETEDSVRKVRRLSEEVAAGAVDVGADMIAFDAARLIELNATVAGLAVELAQETRMLRTALVNAGYLQPYEP